MSRKPEQIFTVYFLLYAIYLTGIGFHYFRTSPNLFKSDLISLFICILICVFFCTYSKKVIVFIFSSIIQFILILIVFMDIGFGEPIINIFFIFLFFLNLTLKLPQVYSLPISSFFLIFTISVANYDKMESMTAGQLLMYGCICLFFSQLIGYYREELVIAKRRNIEYNNSLIKLESVSEALLQHMTEIKEESAEEERLRITRELHDSLGYSMTNIVMIMNAARYLKADDVNNFKEYCLRAKDLASNSMEETRQTLYKLREISRDLPKNPVFFFDRMCRNFQEATGIITECHGGNLCSPLTERIFHTIYRAVQVGFINALKHGETKYIRLFFWDDKREIRITIWNNRNNSVNFNARKEEGIGLKGIRERLDNLGGTLSIDQQRDGFSLLLTIPLGMKESEFSLNGGGR
jgi:signal transduction histidine kinase